MVPLQKIEKFFLDNDPGADPVRLDPCTVVSNPRAFVETSLEILKAAGNKTPAEKRIFLPYYNRLETLYKLKLCQK